METIGFVGLGHMGGNGGAWRLGIVTFPLSDVAKITII